MNDYVISSSDLTKQYGSFKAVDQLDLQVPKGSICGFLGQNGAGKSTTIKMLLGMVKPTSGSGSVLGFDIEEEKSSLEIRKRVAYVAEDKRLYDYMTVAQILNFTRPFFGAWDKDLERHLLDEFKLPINRSIKKLSKGMRTQLALVLGICRNTEILILDEPSEGLDPVNNEKVLKLLVGLASDGKTIFFSSHNVFEVEQVSDYIIMIHKGRLVESKSLEQLKEDNKIIKCLYSEKHNLDLKSLKAAKSVKSDPNSVLVFADGDKSALLDILKQSHPSSVEVINLSLKDIFLENLKALESHVIS
ncbi:MAG: transporter ATP-binding protein [Pedobacter sp.]|jgi:ABC-2 type transport system ATP-binding protein|nr:transporter ATP-binding protein [Pedobacter sp.]